MVNASKILTVSYGTFSCTLEGFDDSFDTMKAIAEYFRDLAADDRYFGAEPPTPDAEMLARIAEREISRRVEAHENEGKIVLRASDATALTTAPTPAQPPFAAPAGTDAKADTPEADATADAQARATDDHLPDAQGQDTPAQDTAEDPKAAEVTAEAEPATDTAQDQSEPDQSELDHPETADIPAPEAPQASDAAQAEERADAQDPATVDADQTADSADASEAEAHDQAQETEAQDATLQDDEAEADTAEAEVTSEDQGVAIEADSPAAEDHDSDAEDHAAPAAKDDDADSVAAKLRRIRSVVADSDEVYAAGDYTEDEHAQDFVDTATDDSETVLDQLSDTGAEADHDTAQDDDLDAILARFDDEPAASDDVPHAEAAPEAKVAEDTDLAEDTLAQLLADAMPAQDSDADESPEPAAATALQDDDADLSDTLHLGPENAIDTAESEAAAEDDRGEEAAESHASEQPVLRARVVKMKRSEFEAAISEGYIEEEADDDQDQSLNMFDEGADQDADLGLSPEEEAELQRELAEVEAEMHLDDEVADQGVDADDLAAAHTEADRDEPTAEDDAQDATLRGRDKLDSEEEPRAEVNRMFDKADTHLDEPASNQRRSVIRHLRAAVAATRAEKKAGGDIEKDVDDSPYRSDLAEVVRPRRPQMSGQPRSARPSEQRAAPLKLVAEQRIDPEAPRDPVRPRRISSTDLTPADKTEVAQDGGFADFADQMGANRLPDLLEAAAAYLSDVEGRPQFSRPMLMGKLKEVSQDGFSREDGLRSFGQLLRDGKLQKLKGGRFTVTEDTDFRDQARNAG